MIGLHSIVLAVTLACGAALFAMHGQGGGAFYAPVQVLFGQSFHEAAARSQLFIFLTALSSTLIFRRAGKVDWLLALTLESMAASGAFLGGVLAVSFPGPVLQKLLGLIVLGSAIVTLSPYASLSPPEEPPTAPWVWRRRLQGAVYDINLLLALPAALGIGVLSGLTGTAGAFLKTLLLMRVFRMPADLAMGTTALMVTLTAVGGLFGHMQASLPDWRPTLALGACVLAGAQIGPRLALQVPEERLRKRFGIFLLIIGTLTFAFAFRR